jgi:hypothetical protein
MAGEQAPGWWQASDGNWYPPSAHPDPAYRATYEGAADPTSASPPTAPPPVAPPPVAAAPVGPPPFGQTPASAGVLEPKPTGGGEGRGRTIVFGVLATLVVVGVGVVAFLLAGGSDDDVASGADRSTTTDADVSPTTADEDTTSTSAPEQSTTTTNLGDLVTSQDITVTNLFFQLPEGWITAAPGSGARGADLFPDDEQLASAFDSNLQVATDSGALLFGLESDLSTEGLLQVHLIGGAELSGGVEEAAANGRAALPGSGATIDVDGPIATGDAEGHIFRYRFPGASGEAFGVQLIVPAAGDVYVLTFSTADESLADELVGVAATCTEA